MTLRLCFTDIFNMLYNGYRKQWRCNMERLRIGYSTTRDVKDYIDKLAEQYNMGVSAVITMVLMQHKLQYETLEKVGTLNSIIEKMGVINKLDDNQ